MQVVYPVMQISVFHCTTTYYYSRLRGRGRTSSWCRPARRSPRRRCSGRRARRSSPAAGRSWRSPRTVDDPPWWVAPLFCAVYYSICCVCGEVRCQSGARPITTLLLGCKKKSRLFLSLYVRYVLPVISRESLRRTEAREREKP